MLSYCKRLLGSIARLLVPFLGKTIVDSRSGERLGKAFLVTWRGNFYVLAYNGEKPLRVVWLEENKVRYWRARIGFTSYTEEEMTDE